MSAGRKPRIFFSRLACVLSGMYLSIREEACLDSDRQRFLAACPIAGDIPMQPDGRDPILSRGDMMYQFSPAPFGGPL